MSPLVPNLAIGPLRADFYRALGNPFPTRHMTILGYAVALSVLVHVAGFLGWGNADSHVALQQSAAPERSVSLRLLSPAPAVVAEPKPRGQINQINRVASPNVPARVTREQKEPRRVSRQAPSRTTQKHVAAVSTPVASNIPAAPAPSAQAAPAPSNVAVAEPLRARYLAMLFAHIERFKFYPAVARRQGLEAAVDVSFTLSAAGNAENINISSGPKLLRHAAQQSLQRAVPLPQPPAGQVLPMRIEYRMVFALR